MDIKHNYDLIIIGAGAAGLAAAIAFRRKCDGTLLVLDLNDEAGRKILATGNGRCNITNTNANGYLKSREFFSSLGILLDIEAEGRVYPLNRQASTVRDALYEEALRLGAEFSFKTKALSVDQGADDNFIIGIKTPNEDSAEEKKVYARQVIIATGGKAAPQYQCFGDGYLFARKLNLNVVNISPALTFFTYAPEVKEELSILKGVRAKANATVIIDGHKVCSEYGEVQFTQKAVSGICIFNLSREVKHHKAMVYDNKNYDNVIISLDFAPNFTIEDLNQLLRSRTAAGLKGILNSKLADYIINKVSSDSISSIHIASMIKNFEINVDGTGGWKDAQVTSGGVDLAEIDLAHSESMKIPGIYFAGEVLNYDGPCGGYNLDFAWNSGIMAGTGAGGYCAYCKRNNS